MRGPEAALPFFNPDSETHTIEQSEPAPGAAHAAFYGPKCLAIGVAALEARGDQLFPNGGEIRQVGAEQVDALPTRDFRIQVVLLGYRTDYDQCIGCDFPSGNP